VNAAAKPTTAPRTPLDVKLFYGFIAVLGVGMAGLLLLWPGPKSRTGIIPDRDRRWESFALTNQAGQLVTTAEFTGKFAVVNFVHSSCSISCLQVNQQMAEVQRLTSGQPDVRLVSLTVDPRTDTPPVLADFGKKFGADQERWQLLTGDKATLYRVIETSFLQRDAEANQSEMPGGFHDTDRIAVVDRSGKVRRYFDGMRKETPAVIVRFLQELRTESK
jgi:protein SCO1/2